MQGQQNQYSYVSNNRQQTLTSSSPHAGPPSAFQQEPPRQSLWHNTVQNFEGQHQVPSLLVHQGNNHNTNTILPFQFETLGTTLVPIAAAATDVHSFQRMVVPTPSSTDVNSQESPMIDPLFYQQWLSFTGGCTTRAQKPLFLQAEENKNAVLQGRFYQEARTVHNPGGSLFMPSFAEFRTQPDGSNVHVTEPIFKLSSTWDHAAKVEDARIQGKTRFLLKGKGDSKIPADSKPEHDVSTIATSDKATNKPLLFPGSNLPARFRSHQTENWMERFQELVAFRNQHGHCLVPNVFKENLPLAEWVKRQRYQYKLFRLGQRSTMSVERMKSLEKLGFVWNSHDQVFEERLKELEDYRAIHGDCNVPSRYSRNPQLAGKKENRFLSLDCICSFTHP